MRTINEYEDVIDVRDVIKRVEELREERTGYVSEATATEESISYGELADAQCEAEAAWDAEYPEDSEELTELESLLADLAGYGGDEEWEGAWYPVTLIRDSYFETYAQELAEDCGQIAPESDLSWPYTCIDWERAARELQMDFGAVEFKDVTYWYR